MAGIAGRQVTLDTKITPSIPALLNSQGTKVSSWYFTALPYGS